MHSVETVLQISILIFLQVSDIVWYSLVILDRSSEPHPPVSHANAKVDNQDTYNHSVPRQHSVFHFQSSIQIQ